MPSLTKENAKHHCRTCLVRLGGRVHALGGGGGHSENTNAITTAVAVTAAAAAAAAEDEVREFKDICINITTNAELQRLIAKYVVGVIADEEQPEYLVERERSSSNAARAELDYPQHLCLGCYNKLQAFEKFRKRAQESAEKLHAVMSGNGGVTKVEIDYEEEPRAVINHDDDIYKLLLKDTLMETESVLLDGSAVATLASVEMGGDPDPFDTATPSKILSASAEYSGTEEEDVYDWQKNVGNDGSTMGGDDASAGIGVGGGNSRNTSSESEDEDEDDMDSNENEQTVDKSKTNQAADEEDDDEEEDEGESDSEEDDEDDDEDENNESGVETKPKQKKPTAGAHSRRKVSSGSINKISKKKRRTKKEMEEWRRTQASKLESKIKRRQKGTKNSFKCAQCNHCFAHKLTLDAHIRKVHEGSKRPYQCDKCDKAYTFIGGLYTHIREIHDTEVRSHTCDHPGCERNYTSYIAMQKHKRNKHTDIGLSQKKYVCEQCGATFNQTGNLKYHRRTKHPTEAEQAEQAASKEHYECKICNKVFHSRYTLKYHTLQLHSAEMMKYECTVCGRRMAKKFMLVQHMLVHSTDKMPCEHCGKQFIRKFELEAHIRAVHMKLKPFECQYCSECFASRKTLRHHEYIHTGEKPYVCDICGQAYRQQTCLKNHRKSHEKLSAEALLAANINRTLMSTFLSGGSQQQQHHHHHHQSPSSSIQQQQQQQHASPIEHASPLLATTLLPPPQQHQLLHHHHHQQHHQQQQLSPQQQQQLSPQQLPIVPSVIAGVDVGMGPSSLN